MLTTLSDAIFTLILENYFTVLGSLLTIAIAIVALSYSVRNYRLNKAKSFEKPELKIGLYEPKPHSDDYYVVIPFKNGSVFLIPLIFIITNEGSKTAKK